MLSLEDTAKELEIPKDAMVWLIELGYIRLTIHKTIFGSGVMIDDYSIPIKALDDRSAIQTLISEHGKELPEYLYMIPIWVRTLSKYTPSPTNMFETLDSEAVQVFTRDGDPIMINFGNTPYDLLSRARFSHEEIARFRGNRVRDLSVFKRSNSFQPFKLPLKVDPVAEAMVDLGNKFFKEKGTTPSGPAKFRKYMIQRANDPWEVIDQYNGDRKKILIEGIPISYESFSKRFKQYLEDNGR